MSGFLRGQGAGTRAVAIIAVAVLAVGAILLSVFALQHGESGAAPTQSPQPAASFTFSDRTTPTATPTTTPIRTAPRSEERFLALQGDRLLRAAAGSCGGPAPVVELSTDGGSTWADVTPGGDLVQVLGIATAAEIDGEVVGAIGSDCTPAVLRTYTSGNAWEQYDALGSVAYLSPSDGVTIHTPSGEVAAPCEAAVSVRMSRGTIGLICDGTAYRLSEPGAWTALTSGAVALDAIGGNLVVARAAESCPDGIAVTQFEGSGENELACIDGADPYSPAALAVLGSDIIMWSGDAILRP